MEKIGSPDGTAIAYEVSGDGPTAVLLGGALSDRRGVTAPALLIGSTTSPAWLRAAAEQTAAALPAGEHRTLEGGFHRIPAQILAPVIVDFFKA